MFSTPWCKDCWFVNSTKNLVRCEYHHTLWSARHRRYAEGLRRKKRFFDIKEVEEEEKNVSLDK